MSELWRTNRFMSHMMFWGRTRWFLCAHSPFLPRPALLLPSNVVSPSNKNKKRLDTRMGFLLYTCMTCPTHTHIHKAHNTHTQHTRTQHTHTSLFLPRPVLLLQTDVVSPSKKTHWYSIGMSTTYVVVSNTYTHTKSTQRTHATYTRTTHTHSAFSTASCAAFTDKCW